MSFFFVPLEISLATSTKGILVDPVRLWIASQVSMARTPKLSISGRL